MTTKGRIQVLPELLVRKIAAGEVVERPASVVKELLENSVDAGATRITVTIADGGKELIRVTDDGIGMSADELRLSVTAHATSKITKESDLSAIDTLGFRGEALASISSVARLCMTSRKHDSVAGHEIRVVADKIETDGAAGCPPGTSVEVRDLFFNVPARRKFLRATSTETGHISEQVARIALGQPQIAFEMINNGRNKLSLPRSADGLERVARFYGPELAEALLPVRRSERGITLEAFVAPPAQSRATAQWQYTFVNGRYIRDRFIQNAIKEAYRGLTEPNRFGVVFLFLKLDPVEVDVNVHPTKVEVRWAEPGLIRSFVLSALKETFQQNDIVPSLRVKHDVDAVSESERDRIRQEMADSFRAMTPIQPGGEGDRGPVLGGYSPKTYDSQPAHPSGLPSDPAEVWRSLYRPPTSEQSLAKAGDDAAGTGYQVDRVAGRELRSSPSDQAFGPTLRPAVQMHNLYLVAETADGIVIIDQHALHERVMYEQLRARITAGPLESQRLLLPETFPVTPQQASMLEEHAELLRQVGIELSPFGADTVAVQGFPSLLRDSDVAAFMRDLMDFLAQQSGGTQADALIDRVISMMACKAAVKAGDVLSQAEIDALFAQRDLIDKSSSCPHGRPTTLRLTKADLDRQFHRT